MKHTLHKCLALVCSIAIMVSLLPTFAIAVSDHEYDWTFFSEDFENFEVGENALYDANPSHIVTQTSYAATSDLGIADDGASQYAKLALQNIGDKSRAQIRSEARVNGAVTATFDFCSLSNQNDFYLKILWKKADKRTGASSVETLSYVTLGDNKAQGSIFAIDASVKGIYKEGTSTRFVFQANTWYTVTYTLSQGAATVSVRERDGVNPIVGTGTISSDTLTQDYLSEDMYLYMELSEKTIAEDSSDYYAVGIDNWQMSKKISITDIAGSISGDAGDHQPLSALTFSDGKPTPSYCYVSRDNTVAAAQGDVAVFIKEGSTIFDLKLCDILGNPQNTVASIPVTVDAAGKIGDYVFFSEDFSAYSTGDNAFKTANPDHYTCATTKDIDTLDIRDDGDGDKYLQLCVRGPKATTKNETIVFTLNDKVSGSYSIEWDYRSAGNRVPYSEGTRTETDGIMIEVAPGIEVRHAVHDGSYVYLMKSSGLIDANKNIGSIYNAYTPNQWYHVRTDVVPGKIVVTVYERGNNTPVSTKVFSLSGITKEYLAQAHNVKFTVGPLGIYPSDVVFKIGIDNIRMIRTDFDQYLPGGILMEQGESVSLSLPQYYPRGLYSTAGLTENVISVGSAGQIVAENAGEGYVLVQGKNALTGAVSATYPIPVQVVQNADRISNDSEKLTFAANAVGATQNLNITVPSAVSQKYPGYSLSYITLDESVATVSNSGIVSAVGNGKTDVLAFLLDSSGEKTEYWTKVSVQVGKQQLKVLSIGNSYSRDSVHYLSHLADMVGENIYTAYLYTGSCNLRIHANAAMYNAPIYTYYTSNKTASSYFNLRSNATMAYALSDEKWDVITLHQGVTYSAMEGTYGGADLDFLLDYIKDTNPQAKIYWNMTWALAENSTHESFAANYDSDPVAQYNAIIDSVNNCIKTDARIDGVIRAGQAVQLARYMNNLTEDDKNAKDNLLRDKLHLAYNRGRLIAGMTWLKTLCPDADLSLITSSGVTTMFNNGAGESNSASYQDACTTMTDSMLNDVRTCVTTAVNTEPQKLAYTNKNTVASNVATTILQAAAPYKLHFPDTTTMDDGTLFVAAYKNVNHTPEIYDKNKKVGGVAIGPFDPMAKTESNSAAPVKNFADIGAGRLVLYRSTDNGTTWSENGSNNKPLLVIDQKQLADWGIADLYGSYSRLKKAGKLPLAADTTEKVPIYLDPRDGNIMSVHTDVDGDGVKENLLTYTFWVRIFNQDSTNIGSGSGGYIITSLDGGNTWTKPVKLANIKRGDLTEFADGEILVPEYNGKTSCAERMKWVNGNWKRQGSVATIAGDAVDPCTEPSFFAPEGGNTVYALTRESGWVFRSTDKGLNWTKIADEDDNSASLRSNGTVEQPSFCNIDGFRTFTVYSNDQGNSNRPIYGGMIYFDDNEANACGWADSGRQLIYSSPNTAAHDTGDPHCTYIPATNKVLVVSYDTYYRSIVGNFLDISESKYRPTEQKTYVQSTAALGNDEEVTLKSFAANSTGTTNILWVSDNPAVATVVNGVVTAVSNGTATITATSGGVSDTCTVTVSGVGITYTANSAHSVTVSAVSAPGNTMAIAFYNAQKRLVKWTTAAISGGTAEKTVSDSSLDFTDLSCKVFFFDASWKPVNASKSPTK